jgi:Fur family ferric uptake transcriptional regulator
MSAVRYNTNQRKLILAVIERNRGRHITAEEVHLELIRAGSPVGKATVYRHFERLEKEGMLPLKGRARAGNTRENPARCLRITT